MSDTAAFWDRIAPKYALRPVSDIPSYEATLERTRAYLNPDMQVLEVGCGTGSTALTLAPATGHITGTDVSGAMIDIARKKISDGTVANVSFARASIDEAGQGRTFDAVLAFNLFHLLPDAPAGIATLRARLEPGGLLISKTACLGERKGFLRLPIAVMRMVGKAPFVAFLTVADLERMITDAGFEIVETGDYPAKMPNHFVVARKV